MQQSCMAEAMVMVHLPLSGWQLGIHYGNESRIMSLLFNYSETGANNTYVEIPRTYCLKCYLTKYDKNVHAKVE